MKKLTFGPFLLFVAIGTVLAAFAGFMFGANLGGNFGCFEFAGDSGYIGCSYFYALVGAGIGLIVSILLGRMLQKVAAIILLVIIVFVLFGSSLIPTFLSVPEKAQNVIESVDVSNTIELP